MRQPSRTPNHSHSSNNPIIYPYRMCFFAGRCVVSVHPSDHVKFLKENQLKFSWNLNKSLPMLFKARWPTAHPYSLLKKQVNRTYKVCSHPCLLSTIYLYTASWLNMSWLSCVHAREKDWRFYQDVQLLQLFLLGSSNLQGNLALCFRERSLLGIFWHSAWS